MYPAGTVLDLAMNRSRTVLMKSGTVPGTRYLYMYEYRYVSTH